MVLQEESDFFPVHIGRYKVNGILGRGSMGIVYKAFDPVIERMVAVKTIDLQLNHGEMQQFKERFHREAKAAGILNHPNIVTIYDISEDEGIAYIAMELLDGLSLQSLLQIGQLPVDRTIGIVTRTANALFYAHNRGVIHRDIKPANIVITKNGLIKITDFGIAHLPASSNTQAGLLIGSPAYMSPEQITGAPIDGRSDIFSLGVVLYELLAGKTPFSGKDIHELMYSILQTHPRPPSHFQSIPAGLDDVVMRALAKNPEDRFADARDFAHALRPFKLRKIADGKTPEAEDLDSNVLPIGEILHLDNGEDVTDQNSKQITYPSLTTTKPTKKFLIPLSVSALGVAVLITIDHFPSPVGDQISPNTVTIQQKASIQPPVQKSISSLAPITQIARDQTPAIVKVFPGPHDKDKKVEPIPPKSSVSLKNIEKRNELNSQIKKLNKELEDLRTRFTDYHPDVIMKKRQIDALEKQKEELIEG